MSLNGRTIPLSKTTKFIVDNRGKTAPTAVTGIALIATNSISNESLYPQYLNVRHVSQETYDTWFRAHPEPGDIILTNKGSQNGAICLVPDPVDFVIAQDMVALRADEKVIDPFFLFAALRSPIVQLQIKNLDVSGIIPHFKKTDFDKLHLPYPNMEIQKAIGRIYFDFCAKIELNRRMNETLEGLARALFQSWFVDFDPVRAKASGQTPPGLPPATAALFPDHFQDSELGQIPKGWRVGKLAECCEKVGNGGTPKRDVSAYWEPPTVPWLTSGEVRQSIITSTENFISEEGFNNSSAKMWQPWTTVVALYGATAGQTSLLAMELCANQACCGFTPKPHHRFFNYLLVSSSVTELEQQARGSAQQNLSKQIVEDLKCVVASDSVLSQFDKLVVPLFDRWVANLRESDSLASLRDALLPKLLSGELRVRDADRAVERSV